MSNGSAHGSLNSLRLSQNGSDSHNNVIDAAPAANNPAGQTNDQAFDQLNNSNAIAEQLKQGQMDSGHSRESRGEMMSWNDWKPTANVDCQHQNDAVHHNIGQQFTEDFGRQSDARLDVGNDFKGVYQSQESSQLNDQSLAGEQRGSTSQVPPQNQSQNAGGDPKLRNTGGMHLNALQNPHQNQLNPIALKNLAAQINTSGIPPNLPPQAHPFYLWMLQQQLANQQGQAKHNHSRQEVAQQNQHHTDVPEEAYRLAEGDAPSKVQMQDTEWTAQELKHKMPRQGEAQLSQVQDRQMQREEQIKILPQQQVNTKCQDETQKQQQEYVQSQVNENVTAAHDALTQPQSANISINSQQQLAQQQLALFQYQLAMAQAQQNNGQVGLSQMPASKNSEEKTLRQQQFQLLQTLQQQAQHQQVQKSTSLAHTSNLSSALPNVPRILQKSSTTRRNYLSTSCEHKAASIPANKTQSRRKTPCSSPQTGAALEAHHQVTTVIENTMKSLNSTMNSIDYGVPQHEVLNSRPQSSMIGEGENQMISGSIKSLNTTLASTLKVPQHHQGTISLEDTKMMVNPNQQQSIPMVAYRSHEAKLQTNPSSVNPTGNLTFLSASSNTPIASSTNVVSSDTDGEFVARKEGKLVSDKYTAESGTDDDGLHTGACFAMAADIEDKPKSVQ